MMTLIRNEWKKIAFSVLFTTVILTVTMTLLSCTIYKSYSLRYDLEAWEVGTKIFSLIYPLVVVIPLCWNLYYEQKNDFLFYVKSRVSIRKYLTSKWIAYALGTLCLIVIPYVLSAIFALYVKEPVVSFENPFHHVFATLFIEMPLLYVLILTVWKASVAILVMSFGFVLALYCKNIFVILTGPFIYSILENFMMSILRLERYRLVVSFDPTSIDSSAVTALSYLSGPAILGGVITLTVFFKKYCNH